jgi:hypothetical protein
MYSFKAFHRSTMVAGSPERRSEACRRRREASSCSASGMLRRKRGKPVMPRPRAGESGEEGRGMERRTGRWSVRIPQAGKISEVVEGKRVRKEEETNHRSRRAPERLEALKWVKSGREGW